MKNESKNAKGWILYVMLLGIGTVTIMLLQGEGTVYEWVAAVGFGGMMLWVSSFFFIMECRCEKFNPMEEEKRLRKLKDITLQKICIYMDSKVVLIIWNIWIAMLIITALIICILSLKEYSKYLGIGIFMLVFGIAADAVINILLRKFYYGRKSYKKKIIKNTQRFLEVDEKYPDILEGNLQNSLIYKSRRLVITDSFILSDYTALPFSEMSDIYLDRLFVSSKSALYLVCKLKNGNKAVFCAAYGYADRILQKVWQYQNIEGFVKE